MTTIVPVVLCGGRGQRLWPLSRASAPKQFLPMATGKSLFADALERADGVRAGAKPLCVVTKAYTRQVSDIARMEKADVDILVEPEAKGTAASVLVAAHWAQQKYGETVLVILPSDHNLPDRALFQDAVQTGVGLAKQGGWAVLGVEARGVDPAFGHIRKGALLEAPGKAYSVLEFIEKPGADSIEGFCEDEWLWHTGIGIVSADTVVSTFDDTHKPFADWCRQAVCNCQSDDVQRDLDKQAYSALEPRGLDRSIYERLSNLIVVPFEGEWSDLGSWQEVEKLARADTAKNCGSGRFHTARTKTTYIRSPHKLTVALGVENLAIVDTPDALLVAHKDALSELPSVLNDLEAEFKPEVNMPSSEVRPWGRFDVVSQAPGFKVKWLEINPGGELSLQYHDRRSEHWVIVRGTATVTCNGVERELCVDESFCVPRGAVHRLENRQTHTLELIEVQIGERPCENDIVRLDDKYHRMP